MSAFLNTSSSIMLQQFRFRLLNNITMYSTLSLDAVALQYIGYKILLPTDTP